MTDALHFYSRIKDNQCNINFNVLVHFVKKIGYKLIRVRGSHQTFQHPCVQSQLLILVNDHGDAVPYQVKTLINQIERYNLI